MSSPLRTVRSSTPSADGKPLGSRRKCRVAERLWDRLYVRFCRRAQARLARIGYPGRWCAAELVHEAYLRLEAQGRSQIDDERHLTFVLNRAMEDVLVEKIRADSCLKRGAGLQFVELQEEQAAEGPCKRERSREVRHALRALSRKRPQDARVLLLSYFAGLTHPEIAAKQGISRATVERRSRDGGRWLRRQLSAIAS